MNVSVKGKQFPSICFSFSKGCYVCRGKSYERAIHTHRSQAVLKVPGEDSQSPSSAGGLEEEAGESAQLLVLGDLGGVGRSPPKAFVVSRILIQLYLHTVGKISI